MQEGLGIRKEIEQECKVETGTVYISLIHLWSRLLDGSLTWYVPGRYVPRAKTVRLSYSPGKIFLAPPL